MMAANGSKKQKDRAQAHRDAAEGMSGTKNRQTQIHAQGKRPPRMRMLGARAWLKALVAAEESLAELRQSFLIARALPADCSAPWAHSSNAAEHASSTEDLEHQIANPML